jgi:hypothetical protein
MMKRCSKLACRTAKFYSVAPCRTLATSIQSPGVVDPFDPRKDASFFTIGGLQNARETAAAAMKSTFAAGRIREGIPTFAPGSFPKEAEALFAGMSVAFSEGDLGSLDRLVTAQLFQSLKSQIKQDHKRVKAKKGKMRGKCAPEFMRKAFHVLNYPEPAKIMQMRVVQNDVQNANTAFGQVTVRIRSLRRQTQFDERGNALCARAFFSPEAAQQRGEKRKDAGEWKTATSADGEVYYWHTVTKETRWTAPDGDVARDYEADGSAAAVAQTEAGKVAVRGASNGSTILADVDTGASMIDAVSYVVFESPLSGSSRMWRICMIDERGSE